MTLWKQLHIRLIAKGWRYSHTYAGHRYYLRGRSAACRIRLRDTAIVG